MAEADYKTIDSDTERSLSDLAKIRQDAMKQKIVCACCVRGLFIGYHVHPWNGTRG